MIFVCPKCRLSIPMKAEEFPLKCRCGMRYAAAADMIGTGTAKVRPLPPPLGGPGTELTAIFADLGIKPKATCGCKAKAAQLDRWGVSGCNEHRAEILAWMQEAYDSAPLQDWLMAGVAAIWQGKPKSLEGLLDLAIDRAEEKITTITCNCDVHGAGDALVMAWVAEGSKGFKPTCKLFATGWRKELLEAFGQEVTGDSTGARDTFKAYSQETQGKGCGSRVIQRGSYLGFYSAPKRPPYVLKESDDRLASMVDGGILLFPCTTDGAREWPPFYWIELYQLLDAVGLEPHIVTPIRDTRYMDLSRCHYAYRWPEVMAAMLKSRAVVCNDSGPMHVAGTLDVKTFAILGPTANEAIHNHMPSVVGLAATKEQIDCVGCYYGRPYAPPCKAGCAALSNLSPQTVFDSIKERL